MKAIFKRNIVLFLFVFLGTQVQAATFYSRPDGTWSKSNGGPNCSCTPSKNDALFVNHDITLPSAFTVNNGEWTINSPSTLIITGNLTFNNNSFILVQNGGAINVGGNFLNKNNSGDVSIFGNLNITGSFTNGTGSGNGAVIDIGGTGNISYNGTCSNPGTIESSGGSYSGCSGGILPIELVSFNAAVNQGTVQIEWSTAHQENFDFFAIERSVDGIDFEVIGEVNGPADSHHILDYKFVDHVPLFHRSYYRLKAIDLDGSFEHSSLVYVDYEPKRTTAAPIVFPNPVIYPSNEVNVFLQQPADKGYISIRSTSGHVIARKELVQGQTQLTFAARFAQGSYIVEVNNNGNISRTKLLVR